MTPPALRPPPPEPAVPPVSATTSEEGVRADLRRLLQARLIRESGLVLIGHPLMMALVVYATWNELPHSAALGWALAVLLATVFRSSGCARCINGPSRTGTLVGADSRRPLLVCWGSARRVMKDLPFADRRCCSSCCRHDCRSSQSHSGDR